MSTALVELHTAAWPWTHAPMFDPLPPPRGVLNPFFGSSRSWWRTHSGAQDPKGAIQHGYGTVLQGR